MNRICLLSVIFIFALPFYGNCQFTINAGGAFGSPFFLNRQGYYSAAFFGIEGSISYTPPNSNIYPSVSFETSNFQLPLQTPYYDNLGVSADYHSCTLDLNYKKSDNFRQYFVYYAGVGICKISPNKQVNADGNSTIYNLVDTGDVDLYPTINIGILFFRKLSAKYPLYLSINARINYIYMHANNNKDYIGSDYSTNFLPVKLEGDILYPGAYISIGYIFRRKDNY